MAFRQRKFLKLCELVCRLHVGLFFLCRHMWAREIVSIHENGVPNNMMTLKQLIIHQWNKVAGDYEKFLINAIIKFMRFGLTIPTKLLLYWYELMMGKLGGKINLINSTQVDSLTDGNNWCFWKLATLFGQMWSVSVTQRSLSCGWRRHVQVTLRADSAPLITKLGQSRQSLMAWVIDQRLLKVLVLRSTKLGQVSTSSIVCYIISNGIS